MTLNKVLFVLNVIFGINAAYNQNYVFALLNVLALIFLYTEIK